MRVSTAQPPMIAATRVAPEAQASNPPVASEVVAAPDVDRVERKEIDDKNFSWLDLGKGITGSVIGGAIEGTGAALAGVLKSPRITYEAVKGTWKSKMLGPVLKATLTPVIIAAGVVAPVFAAIGGLGYGMFEGFKEGAERNPLAAGSKAIETTKKMHGKFTGEIVDGIRDLATKEPKSPDEVYEIKVIEAGKGLAASATSAVIDGAGIGLSTALHTPQAYLKVSKELWKSDSALPLKVGGQFLATAGAVLAAPLGFVGGTLYGLGKGAYNGYQQGFLGATEAAFHDVKEYNSAVHKFVSQA